MIGERLEVSSDLARSGSERLANNNFFERGCDLLHNWSVHSLVRIFIFLQSADDLV